MAGEQRGQCYEALITLLIDELKTEGCQALEKVELYWERLPKRLTTVPDLYLAETEELPQVIFLISHCTSAKNSELKWWRNLSELIELKCAVNPPPKAILVLFEATVKATILQMQRVVFDELIIIEERPEWTTLQAHLDELLTLAPRTREGKRVAFKSYAENHDDLRAALSSLKSAFHPTLSPTRSESTLQEWSSIHQSLWALELKKAINAAPNSSN